jgi:serine O-acetyltransferase
MSVPETSSFWSLVSADLRRYGTVSVNAFVKRYLLAPGFKYTFWLRLTYCVRQKGLFWRPYHYLCRMILSRCGVRYGISIPYNTRIGPGLYIGHHGGIVVNHDVVIGRDCNINHEVTIGAKYGGKNPGVPVIGDRVYLGPGCKVIGGVYLGNDVAVGANSVVLDSIPDSAVAAGIPAKLVSFRGSSDYVINTDSKAEQNVCHTKKYASTSRM